MPRGEASGRNDVEMRESREGRGNTNKKGSRRGQVFRSKGRLGVSPGCLALTFLLPLGACSVILCVQAPI